MLSINFLSFFSILITTVQARAGSAADEIAKLPTSIPPGYDGLRSVFRVFCDGIVYTNKEIVESVSLGCRRTNRKGSKVVNPLAGLVLRAPKIYKPQTPADAFQIPGKPYRMTALEYQTRKKNPRGTDYTVMNDKCQFVGVVTEYQASRINRRPRKTTKCPMDLFLRPLREAQAAAI